MTSHLPPVDYFPVFRCGMCREDRPHHMPDSGVAICAACGYVRDETEVKR